MEGVTSPGPFLNQVQDKLLAGGEVLLLEGGVLCYNKTVMDRMLKIGFGMLALLAVLFGFVRIGQSLKLTFASDDASVAGSGVEQEDALEEAKLRVRDTDSDGLMDWDELNAYGTSPYLADSDSDGVSDSDEISQGQDPNCPAGRECGSSGLVPLAGGTAPGDALGRSPTGGLDEATRGILDSLQSGAAPTADDIRALLKQGGVTDSELEGVADEQLLNLFDEIAGQELEGQ